MENFSQEVTLGWISWEAILKNNPTSENSTLVWCSHWSVNIGLDVSNITFRILNELDAFKALV